MLEFLPESKIPTTIAFPNLAFFHNDSLGTFPDSSSSPKNSQECVVCSWRSRLGRTESTCGDSVAQDITKLRSTCCKKEILPTNYIQIRENCHFLQQTCKQSGLCSSHGRGESVEHVLVTIQHSYCCDFLITVCTQAADSIHAPQI